MDEKRIYQIYVGVMKLHKKYFDQQLDGTHLMSFVADINALNTAFLSNFCNAMTDSLRRWFIGGFYGLDMGDIAGFYTDLWRFHKKYITSEQNDDFWQSVADDIRGLDQKYPFQQFRWFAAAIVNELELSGEWQAPNAK